MPDSPRHDDLSRRSSQAKDEAPEGGPAALDAILRQISDLRSSIKALPTATPADLQNSAQAWRLVTESGSLIAELKHLRERISPIRFGSIGITLGRSDSIAKFFAFSFSNQEKREPTSAPPGTPCTPAAAGPKTPRPTKCDAPTLKPGSTSTCICPPPIPNRAALFKLLSLE